MNTCNRCKTPLEKKEWFCMKTTRKEIKICASCHRTLMMNFINDKNLASKFRVYTEDYLKKHFGF